MKRSTILLCGFLLTLGALAVGYSDSHVISKECIQAHQDFSYAVVASVTKVAVFTAELPSPLAIEAPYLGRPMTNLPLVSEKLACGFKMSPRAPPEYRPKIS